MHELKVLIYKDNKTPKGLSIKLSTVHRFLFLLFSLSLTLVVLAGVTTKLVLKGKNTAAPVAVQEDSSKDGNMGPSNTTEDQNKQLRDEIDSLKAQAKNQQAIQAAPKELEKGQAVLGLFPPIISDHTKNQQVIAAKNFQYEAGTPATLRFELHNAQESQTVAQKGYIVVLARFANELKVYPNAVTAEGNYLIDFEKGETFNVQRFRYVNAQFDIDKKHTQISFQILIFNRNGELLINHSFQKK